MHSVLYEFENLLLDKQKDYIFQRIKHRKLSNIYHSHNFYELVWFVQGNGIQMVNEHQMVCKEDCVILLRPNDRHCFINQSNRIEVISLSIKKEEFELVSGVYDAFLSTHIKQSHTPIVLNNVPFSDSSATSSKATITEYDCKWMLADFLHAYITNYPVADHGINIPGQLATAAEEMKQTANLKRGIPAFCELSHYSQSHLSRLVKQHFNMSLKQYINELRLQSAYNEIVLTKKSAEEISESLGFSSFSHFNKIFKTKFCITPSALRKRRGAWTV